MIPYARHQIRAEDRQAVREALDSGWLTQGPGVGVFESELGRRTGCDHAVAVSSGTSALQIALQALGLAPGDEVLVPSLSFLATANAVLLAGGVPVFVDVRPETLSIDPEDLERKITPRTAGSIVVHYAGHPAQVAECVAALGPDRFVLEDACHALGADDGGVPAGSLADAACFSFHPAKHVTTGEGGAITTADPELASRCRRLREHGVERNAQIWQGLGLPERLRDEQRGGWVYEMQALSGNHRLSDLGAALGTSQLARLDEILEERRALASRYDDLLEDDGRITRLSERSGTHSAWHLYPVRLASEGIRGGRAAVHSALHAAGIAAQVHYIPIHLQPFYRARFGSKFGDLPATEAAYLELLSLPLFPGLARTDQDRVVETLSATLDELAR